MHQLISGWRIPNKRTHSIRHKKISLGRAEQVKTLLQAKDPDIYLRRVIPGQKEHGPIPRSTNLIIVAHPDDVEFWFANAVLAGYLDPNKEGCLVVVVSDGARSPTGLKGKNLSKVALQKAKQKLVQTRVKEQRKAADIGDYLGAIQLKYTTIETRDTKRHKSPTNDLSKIIKMSRPKRVFVHSPYDHNTHVAVTKRTIEALCQIKPAERPKELYAMEGWKSISRIAPASLLRRFDISLLPNLQKKLIAAFKSQADGKDYPNTVMGRRAAHATFADSHSKDTSSLELLGLDMSEILRNPQQDIIKWLDKILRQTSQEVLRGYSRIPLN